MRWYWFFALAVLLLGACILAPFVMLLVHARIALLVIFS